jgi:RNA polymerase sigma-70 factor (sigma-E family)
MRNVHMPEGKRDPLTARPTHVTGSVMAGAALGSVAAHWDADRAVTVMYGEHYGSLVRMAALLVGDVAMAETVVQDSFVAMHSAWRRLRNGESALAYLHQCVVNRSRSALRHQSATGRHTARLVPCLRSTGRETPPLLEFAVVRALRTLPLRQREALVLIYCGDLTEAQAASAMGIKPGAVKSHLAGAIEALRDGRGSET